MLKRKGIKIDVLETIARQHECNPKVCTLPYCDQAPLQPLYAYAQTLKSGQEIYVCLIKETIKEMRL